MTVVLGGCGGGGGSGAPTQPAAPPPVFPVEPPGTTPSRARIVLESGDLLADLGVASIEDAARAPDGTIGAIVSVSSRGGARAVVRRLPAGDFAPVFDERNAPTEVDLRTIVRLRMAATGAMIFQTGDGPDSDRLFLATGDEIVPLAGGSPGPVAPEFRVLGNVRIGETGVVAFAGGGYDCETSVTPGGALRHVCTVSLFVARNGSVERVATEDLSLVGVATNNVRVEIGPTGIPYFSVPARMGAPAILRVPEATAEVFLAAEQEIPGIGALRDLQAIDIGIDGRALLSGSLPPSQDGAPRVGALAVFGADHGTRIATQGDSLEGGVVQSLRGVAIDAAGEVLYEALIAPGVDQPAQRSLRLADPSQGRDVELARETRPPPDGGESTIVSIDSSRMNEVGDVVFVTSLGRIADGTVFIEEIRATLRRADGSFETLLSRADTARLGAVSRLTIADFDDRANVLLLAERGRSSDRALLLAPGDAAPPAP